MLIKQFKAAKNLLPFWFCEQPGLSKQFLALVQ